ncbi:MAG: type II secretion system F family protein [Candidatus Omnitrophica bacterium]|nr:type II secretion system F family protein [Candidatus Omnitrophota bacterium]
MPKFFITFKDKTGKNKTSLVDDRDSNSAVAGVQAQGFYVIAVQPMEEAVPNAPVSAAALQNRKFTHNNVRLMDIVVFARQLATMLESGVPLLRSLTVILDQLESRQLAMVVAQVRADIEQGLAFSKALEKHPKVFSQFWVSLVEVGEASGTMPKVLKKLTEYAEESVKFQSQLVGAMIYPGVLLFIVTLAVLAFALFVGPIFEKVFMDMKMELPGITSFMMGLFKFIQTKFLFIIMGITGFVFAFKAYAATAGGRWQIEMLLYNVPTLGNIIRLIVVEKFTSQMAILIESGVPILYALEISERLVDNMVCAAVLKDVREDVREGKLLADSLEKSTFFPSMAVQMIRVGEETGELSKMLGHVSVFYKEQVQEFMKNISVLIEPVMLVVMGGVIGTMVVAMFLPLLSISTGG